jgi:hypothetical protein
LHRIQFVSVTPTQPPVFVDPFAQIEHGMSIPARSSTPQPYRYKPSATTPSPLNISQEVHTRSLDGLQEVDSKKPVPQLVVVQLRQIPSDIAGSVPHASLYCKVSHCSVSHDTQTPSEVAPHPSRYDPNAHENSAHVPHVLSTSLEH